MNGRIGKASYLICHPLITETDLENLQMGLKMSRTAMLIISPNASSEIILSLHLTLSTPSLDSPSNDTGSSPNVFRMTINGELTVKIFGSAFDGISGNNDRTSKNFKLETF